MREAPWREGKEGEDANTGPAIGEAEAEEVMDGKAGSDLAVLADEEDRGTVGEPASVVAADRKAAVS